MPSHKETKTCVGISLDKDVLRQIEERRGLVKRSTYLNNLLRNFLCRSVEFSKERNRTETKE
jgi:metal-responsive CopG/Arc/MetJ family transcriptional regulator